MKRPKKTGNRIPKCLFQSFSHPPSKWRKKLYHNYRQYKSSPQPKINVVNAVNSGNMQNTHVRVHTKEISVFILLHCSFYKQPLKSLL